MKIKQKKQLNLSQLIEWAWKNDVNSRRFISSHNTSVTFSEYGNFSTSVKYIFKDETFTVEVDEEITEDTEIPKLMTTFKKTYLKDDFGYQRVRIDENYPIKLMLNRAEEHEEPIETLHVVNDDGTHTLIWRDGKLVE